MKLTQLFDTPLLTVDELSKKYDVDASVVKKELVNGIRVEMEHTTHKIAARKIALAHLGEDLDYYKKLAKVEKESIDLTEAFKRIEHAEWNHYSGYIDEFYSITKEIDSHSVRISLEKKENTEASFTVRSLLPDDTTGYSILFTVDDRMGAYNDSFKNAIKILGEVSALVLGKLQNTQNPSGLPWDFVYFTGYGQRLTDFYTKIAPQFADTLGGKLKIGRSGLGFAIIKKEKLSETVHIDNEKGWGNVPNNKNVDYLGLRVMMKPSKFLELAAYLAREKAESLHSISSHLEKGGKIASPFLVISLPEKWKDSDYSASARVQNHEGRNRMMAIQDMHGDIPVETHLFFSGGLRARHIKPEWILELNQQLIPEKQSSPIQGPFFATQLNESLRLANGKPVVKNPTPDALAVLIKKAEDHSLRGLIDGNDIYWWDAYDTYHNDVAKKLGISSRQQNHIYLRTGTRRYGDNLVLDITWALDDIKKHPQLNRLLNSNIIFPGISNDLSEDFTKTKLDSPEFKNWFGNSKVVDSEYNPLPVYHGTGRPDRVGSQFRKSRATAGPMAYFTENPETASNYSTNKADTSLSDEDAGYETWFKVKVKGYRNDWNINRAWYRLPAEEQARIRQLAPRVTTDDTGEEILLGDENHTIGLGGFEYHLKQAKGNVLEALVEEWLISGKLFGYEEEFLKVLKLAGMTTPVRFAHPSATTPFVYKVYLSIQNPLDTANIPTNVIDALGKAVRRQPRKPLNSQVWDKRTQDAQQWYQMLLDPKRITYAWTTIPDWVTITLESLGYDGIKDTGGKGGGEQHTVWIPFHENQVKSAISNVTFSRSKNIMKETNLREIEIMPEQSFGQDHILQALEQATKQPTTISGYEIYLLDQDDNRLVAAWDDKNKKLAAAVIFHHQPQIRERLWIAKNTQTFPDYQGKALCGKLYLYCKKTLGMTIQSDIIQSKSAKKLWTSTLPKLGLHPKVLDLETSRVYDSDKVDPYQDNNHKYCWIIESTDKYPNQLRENSLSKPYKMYAGVAELKTITEAIDITKMPENAGIEEDLADFMAISFSVNNNKYTFHAEKVADEGRNYYHNIWDIGFRLNHPTKHGHGITGTGKQQTVFGYVGWCIKYLIKKHNPDGILFYAPREKGTDAGKIDSRAKFYDWLVTLFKKHGMVREPNPSQYINNLNAYVDVHDPVYLFWTNPPNNGNPKNVQEVFKNIKPDVDAEWEKEDSMVSGTTPEQNIKTPKFFTTFHRKGDKIQIAFKQDWQNKYGKRWELSGIGYEITFTVNDSLYKTDFSNRVEIFGLLTAIIQKIKGFLAIHPHDYIYFSGDRRGPESRIKLYNALAKRFSEEEDLKLLTDMIGYSKYYALYGFDSVVTEDGGTGLVVPGVNMPAGIHPDEIRRQAKKFGNRVSKDGVPPVAKSNGEIDESKNKPKPTNPELWSRAKAWARRTYDVYPSAYANAGASKWYKKHGGGWKMSENLQCDDALDDIDYCINCKNLIISESYNGGLKKWFKEKWVNIAKKVGGKHPPCGTSGDSSGYAKCVPAKKAKQMSKKAKESATRRKRRAQNVAHRPGKDSEGSGHKPIMVKTNGRKNK